MIAVAVLNHSLLNEGCRHVSPLTTAERRASAVPRLLAAAMELSAKHAKLIGQPVARRMDYFRRLKARMDARGFAQSNPTYQSMESLNIRLHYAACPPGSTGTPDGPRT